MTLLNPNHYEPTGLDEKSADLMTKTIAFFEDKGLKRLKHDDHERVWYADFLDFLKANEGFYQLLTPTQYGEDGCRWDTHRNCEFSEILAFYGLHYWYAWQVTILGLGPIWMSDQLEVKARAAQLLKEGEVFAFGLSEKEHGADVYASEMTLTPQEDGGFLANGRKYFIGNANVAPMVSTFGRIEGTDDYVFFVVNSQAERYELIRNVVNVQSYVAEYALHDYPVAAGEVLSRGKAAWDAALNTVNVGKFNLGWASIGICTHAFYEAIDHAANRRLYKKMVTDFSHVRRLFVDAYTRLIAMKRFAQRASDYMRSASREDRRYLLYNPMVKMKVTMQGEAVINALWDIIAARGFENETYFEMATRDIRALPKLEGTAHVNMALITKFMANYFFNPGDFPDIPRRDDPVNDDFLFNQGPASGLSAIRFHGYREAYARFDLPNIKRFLVQVGALERFLQTAPPSREQQRDPDFLLTLGELFTLVPYGQLILENAAMTGLDGDTIDQIFDFMIRDFSHFALELYHKPSSSAEQMALCLTMLGKPVVDPARFDRVWRDRVLSLKGAYRMNDTLL